VPWYAGRTNTRPPATAVQGLPTQKVIGLGPGIAQKFDALQPRDLYIRTYRHMEAGYHLHVAGRGHVRVAEGWAGGVPKKLVTEDIDVSVWPPASCF